MESSPPLHLGVIDIEKGAVGSPSTRVANFTYLQEDPLFKVKLDLFI